VSIVTAALKVKLEDSDDARELQRNRNALIVRCIFSRGRAVIRAADAPTN
jgi:hypothetical protein